MAADNSSGLSLPPKNLELREKEAAVLQGDDLALSVSIPDQDPVEINVREVNAYQFQVSLGSNAENRGRSELSVPPDCVLVGALRTDCGAARSVVTRT